MGRKASGNERVDYIEKDQGNGTTYVYKRVSVYSKEKGYYVSKGQTLLGKKIDGSDEIVPTRPKSPKGARKQYAAEKMTSKSGVTATRIRMGASLITRQIGMSSGIDEDVYRSCDEGTAKKIITLARYYLQSDGEATSHLGKWQLTHTMSPYDHPISEDTAHDTFVHVGSDETISQSVFLNRAERLNDVSVLAYDATTVSTYGLNHNRARYGYNKCGDSLETDKIFTFYSMETRQPVCYTTVPGNIPDVIAVENATKQLKVLGLEHAEVISDCGFYSENNISLLFQSSYNFVTRIPCDTKWIRLEVDKALEQLEDTGHMCPDEQGTYGETICITHEFAKTRKYASKNKGLETVDEEYFTKRVYLHIYFNDVNRIKKNRSFDNELHQLRTEYEGGQREFKPAAQKLIDKFLMIKRKRNGKAEITFNTRAIKNAKKYNGVFVLIANKEKDTFEALRKYRKREWIEDFFEEYKQRIGSSKYRVWDDLTLDGKKLVQFVALCYYEYFSRELRKMKDRLGQPTGEHNHDLKTNIDKEKKLKSWLENTSIQEIFDWFDAVEKIEVATPYAKKMWTTEVIERDEMFLSQLGIEI